MEAFQVQCMIDDVARAKSDLAELSLDASVTPDRFAKCEVAASDLETVVTELLTTAWIPKNSHELTACIACVHKNIQRVQSDVAAALDVVLLKCKPDELFRIWCAMSFAELLKVQLGVLTTVLAMVMKNQPQGHIWIN